MIKRKLIHYVYKTTNLINNDFYIGVHRSHDIEKSTYLGSGKHLKRAINKYGVKNFRREILYFFDNKYSAYIAEGMLVDKEFISREDTYNMKLGGYGGLDQCKTPEAMKRRSEVMLERGLNIPTHCNTPESRAKVKLKMEENYGSITGHMNNPETIKTRLSNNYKKRIEKYPFLSLSIIIKSEEDETLFSDTIHNISKTICPKQVPGFGKRLHNHLTNKTLFTYKDFKNCTVSSSEN